MKNLSGKNISKNLKGEYVINITNVAIKCIHDLHNYISKIYDIKQLERKYYI